MRRISIIVPVYYGRKYMEGMIRQVEDCRGRLEQEDYVELLFVNDAPDDPLPVKWESKEIHVEVMNTDCNVGIQGARIKGLKKCCGEYVQFLDQDDFIKVEYLKSQLSAIGTNDAVICRAIHAGKMWYSGENIFEKTISKEYMLGMQWGWNPIASPGQVLLKKNAIPERWTKNILRNRGGDDWLLWLYMISEGCSFALNQDVLYEHVVHKGNFSNHIVEMLQSEQEVVRIACAEKLFSDNDLLMLMDGFFKRNIMRGKEHASLKKKWDVLDKWMLLKENGIKFSEHLLGMGICRVAVYGCTVLGQCLYDEIKTDVQVQYFIDRNADRMKKKIPVYSLKSDLPEVDCVIITLIDEAEKVQREVAELLHVKVIVLKDWIMGL